MSIPLSGCSLIFVEAPPAHPERLSSESAVTCTTGKAAPVVDTIIAGLQVVRTAVAVSADDSVYTDAPISREADVGLGVGFTALFAASAVYGYVTTGKCKSIKRGTYDEEFPQRRNVEPMEPWAAPPTAQATPATAQAAPATAQVAQPTAQGAQAAPAAPTAATQAVCTPGQTQRCVGAGACEGGQSCNAQGTGWAACDCAQAEATE